MVRIGLSASLFEDTDRFFRGTYKSGMHNAYVEAVARAGATPLVLPVTSEPDRLEDMVCAVDGLILTGGADVSPSLYGEQPRSALAEIVPRRDANEGALYEFALRHGRPVFGICRGFQLINVLRDGTLIQDLAYRETETLKHVQEAPFDACTHEVVCEPNSVMHKLFGDRVAVNSFHHQVIGRLGEGLRATARAADGVIEAFESVDDGPFVFGVQWHPEMLARRLDAMQALFTFFVGRTARDH